MLIGILKRIRSRPFIILKLTEELLTEPRAKSFNLKKKNLKTPLDHINNKGYKSCSL